MKIKKLAAVFLALAAVLCLCACEGSAGESTEDASELWAPNVKECVKISFSGYDTLGTAQVRIDCSAFVKNNRKIFGLSLSSGADEISAAAAGLEKLLKGSPEKTEGLSNGQILKFTWDGGAEKLTSALEAKYGKGSMTASDFEVRVSSLAPLVEYSPEKDHTVSFEGIDGEGVAVVRFASGLPEEARKCALTKSEGLKNGENITLIFDASVSDYYLSLGKKVTSLSFTHTVEGLASYVTKADSIKPEEFGLFEPEIAEALDRYASSHLRSGTGIELKELFGQLVVCFDSDGPEDGGRSHNRLYMIFKAALTETETETETKEFFFAPYIIDAACTPAGELPDSVAYHPVLPLGDGDPGFACEAGTVKGFETLEDLWIGLADGAEVKETDASFEAPGIPQAQTQESDE